MSRYKDADEILEAMDTWPVWKDNSLPRTYCPTCGAKMDEEVKS